jgi:AraC family transcriptional regulator
MGIYTPGPRRYPRSSALLASSAGLGWPFISVQLLSHGVCKVPPVVLPSVEICLVVAGSEHGLVRRDTTGFYQEAPPRTGAIWLSPAGLGKEIEITAPIPETAHLLLTPGLFDRLKDDFRLSETPAYSIRNEAGITNWQRRQQLVDCMLKPRLSRSRVA